MSAVTEPDAATTPANAAGTAVSVLLALMRSELKIVALIGTAIVAGFIYAEGFSTTTIVVSLIAVLIIGPFAALVWFWTAIFTSFNSQKKP